MICVFFFVVAFGFVDALYQLTLGYPVEVKIPDEGPLCQFQVTIPKDVYAFDVLLDVANPSVLSAGQVTGLCCAAQESSVHLYRNFNFIF